MVKWIQIQRTCSHITTVTAPASPRMLRASRPPRLCRAVLRGVRTPIGVIGPNTAISQWWPGRWARFASNSPTRQGSQRTAVLSGAAAGRSDDSKPTAAGSSAVTDKASSVVTDKQMVQTLEQHLWPAGPGHRDLKARVVASVGLLVGAKLLTIQVSLHPSADCHPCIGDC